MAKFNKYVLNKSTSPQEIRRILQNIQTKAFDVMGDMAEQDADSVVITGGAISGVPLDDVVSIDFDLDAGATMEEGRLAWNDDDGTLQIGMPGGNVNLQVGQEVLLRAKATEDISNGELVYISGASGSRPEMSLAQADSEPTAHKTIAMATEDITSGQNGYVTTFGLVRDVNTDPGTFTAGDEIFLSAATAGAFTKTEPTNPNYSVTIGTVLRAHATEGIVFVNIHSDIWKTYNDNDLMYFGSGRDATISYDGTDFVFNPDLVGSGKLKIDGALNVTDTTDSTSKTTGSAIFGGGIGVEKSIFIGNNIDMGSNTSGSTATPPSINMGYSFSDTAQDAVGITKGKIYWYNDGAGNVSGIEQSGTEVNFFNNIGSRYGFWRNGVRLLDISETAVTSFPPFYVQDTTDSTSVGTGSVITSGGLSVAKTMWIGQNINIDSDTYGLVLGDGQDMTISYDGTDAKIVTDNVAPSDLIVDCGTNKTLELAEAVWDDMQIDIGAVQLPPANAASIVLNPAADTGLAIQFENAKTQSVHFNMQSPHARKDESNIDLHMHVTPGTSTNTGNVRMQLDYDWQNINGTYGGTTTVYKTFAMDGTAHKHQFEEIAEISGTGMSSISSIICCKLTRLGTDALDTFTGDIYAVGLDFHVVKDTQGSRQETVK